LALVLYAGEGNLQLSKDKEEMRPSRRSTNGRRPRDVTSSLSSNYDSVFVHRKNALYRRAAELSAITDCEIAIVVLSPDGELSQFSTAPMKKILRTYSRLCSMPHEIHNMESIQEKVLSAGGDGIGLAYSKKNKVDGVAGQKKKQQDGNAKSKAKADKKKLEKNQIDDEEDLETIEAILSMGTVNHQAPQDEGVAADCSNDPGSDVKDNVKQEEDAAQPKTQFKKLVQQDVSGKKHRLSRVSSGDNGKVSVNPENEESDEGTPEQGGSPTEAGVSSGQDIDIGTPLNKKQRPAPPSVEPVSLLGPGPLGKDNIKAEQS